MKLRKDSATPSRSEIRGLPPDPGDLRDHGWNAFRPVPGARRARNNREQVVRQRAEGRAVGAESGCGSLANTRGPNLTMHHVGGRFQNTTGPTTNGSGTPGGGRDAGPSRQPGGGSLSETRTVSTPPGDVRFVRFRS